MIGRAIGDTLAFCPPMTITEAEIDEMFAPVEAALDATLGLGEGRGASRLSGPRRARAASMNPLRGIGLKVLSVMRLHGDGDLHQGLGAARAAGAGGLLPLVLRHAGHPRLARLAARPAPRPRHPATRSGHLWRGLVGTSAMGLGFTALGLLPLPEATALGYAAPLLTVIFAAMFLGEQVRVFRLTAVAFGLVGVLIVLWPHADR